MSQPDSNNPTQRSAIWSERLREARERIDTPKLVVEGRLTRMVGLTLEAVGCHAPVGARCLVEGPGGTDIEAEPELSPIPVSTEAAMLSSSSSSSSPVLFAVPPVRMTMPVIEARPILSAGS